MQKTNLTELKVITVVECVKNVPKNIEINAMKKRQEIQVVGIVVGARNVAINNL
jgi:hypothetical protein